MPICMGREHQSIWKRQVERPSELTQNVFTPPAPAVAGCIPASGRCFLICNALHHDEPPRTFTGESRTSGFTVKVICQRKQRFGDGSTGAAYRFGARRYQCAPPPQPNPCWCRRLGTCPSVPPMAAKHEMQRNNTKLRCG